MTDDQLKTSKPRAANVSDFVNSVRARKAKNHTLSSGTSPYRPYKRVPPPPPPTGGQNSHTSLKSAVTFFETSLRVGGAHKN